jgi:molybdopterin biosynthesis enzyme
LTGDGFALVGPQESHALFALSQSDALVRLEPNQEAAEGEILEALLIN